MLSKKRLKIYTYPRNPPTPEEAEQYFIDRCVKRDHVGSHWIRHSIFVKDATEAEFIAKLKYDTVRPEMFYRAVINAYLDDDENIMTIINKIRAEKCARDYNKQYTKNKIKREKVTNDFNIDQNEVEEIFDILEKEELEDEYF